MNNLPKKEEQRMLLVVGMDSQGNGAKHSRKRRCKMKEEDDNHTSFDRRDRENALDMRVLF